MAVRTAYVGTQIAGDVLTSANFDRLPGGWIGYNQVTASQTGITTETDLTGLSVTVTVNNDRRIRITGSSTVISQTNNSAAIGRIRESTTELARWCTTQTIVVGEFIRQEAGVVLTPTEGSHTYKLQLERLSGTGEVGTSATATVPSFILVEDLGPAT